MTRIVRNGKIIEELMYYIGACVGFRENGSDYITLTK